MSLSLIFGPDVLRISSRSSVWKSSISERAERITSLSCDSPAVISLEVVLKSLLLLRKAETEKVCVIP